MKKSMVGEVPSNLLGMLADFFQKIQHGVITAQEFSRFLKRENPFVTLSYSDLINEWRKFYKKIFNITVDLSDIRIPEKKEGLNWLLIMVQGLTAQLLFKKCQELFRTWKWTDKDLSVLSDRSITNTYAIWLRDRVEADEEQKNLSANDLKNKNIPGITLEERLLLELFYFWKTKQHLDIQNWTLCSGSRYFDGDVPRVYWRSFNDKLYVDWCSPGNACDDLRARQVVS